MRTAICPICGKEFETARPNKKYCSLICREAGKQLRRLYWKEENPTYNADYYREHKKGKSEMEKEKEEKVIYWPRDELMKMPAEIPEPRMTAEEFKRKIDFHDGDIVQIIRGKHIGRLAIIIGIEAFTTKGGKEYIAYQLKLSDNESVSLGARYFKFIKSAEDTKE